MRPDTASHPAYFKTYINLVPESNIKTAILVQTPKANQFFQSISEEQSLYRYSEDKWTIKEILQHVIDTERIFCYRALAIARGEKNILPGFDESSYGMNAHANDRTWKDLTDEFTAVRISTEYLVKSFNEDDFVKSGSVSDYRISLLAILYTIVGHVAHHINIIKERYLDVE